MSINVPRLISISSPHAKYTVKTVLRKGGPVYLSADLRLVIDKMIEDDQGPDNDFDKMNSCDNEARRRVGKDKGLRKVPEEVSSTDIINCFLAVAVERGIIRLEPPKS